MIATSNSPARMNLNNSLPKWSRRATFITAALLSAVETCRAQTIPTATADAATLARWDKNKNGRLDPDELAAKHQNFTFETALSAPLDEDGWSGHTGFIHEVVLAKALENHPQIAGVEFYLCGPPMMNAAVFKTLLDLGVERENIMLDDFGG